MGLKDKLNSELRDALKNGLKEKAGVLRLLLAQIQNKVIEKRTAGKTEELTNEEILDILKKEVKKRKESIALFQQGNRQDLASKEEREISLINEYLPPSLSKEEIKKIVLEIKNEGRGKDFNSLMKESMSRLRGQADGKEVGEVVKEILSGEQHK